MKDETVLSELLWRCSADTGPTQLNSSQRKLTSDLSRNTRAGGGVVFPADPVKALKQPQLSDNNVLFLDRKNSDVRPVKTCHSTTSSSQTLCAEALGDCVKAEETIWYFIRIVYGELLAAWVSIWFCQSNTI
ncbi:hypothetical protein JOB18_024730 [Solea senegalensis]|uniref:Uncharacterized protein n=1 Tax=Solea senegalensis TaxID=28829 RepID=A0AAV6PQR6_SOLSE|nr:hypothetical protein JOB18_024730 [Solea senegalensis]